MITAALLCILAPMAAIAQQPSANPAAAACGSATASFKVSRDKHRPAPPQIPPGKALVYFVQFMDSTAPYTTKVNLGLDGNWLGATENETYNSFIIDPGVHHLCAVYQGEARPMDDEGDTLLLHLQAEAGKTYYVRYHANLIARLAFFDLVDEDEGQFLVQSADHATSVQKKK